MRISITIIVALALFLTSCKNDLAKGENDPTQMPDYWGSADMGATNYPKEARAVIAFENFELGSNPALQTFFISDNFQIDSFRLYNEKGNDLTPFVEGLWLEQGHRLDKFFITYKVKSEFSAETKNQRYFLQRDQSGKQPEVWTLGQDNFPGTKSPYSEVLYIGSELCDLTTTGSPACNSFAISGHSPRGAKIDAYGNIVYQHLNDYHYIKSSGGLLQLNFRPRSVLLGIDGDFYLQEDFQTVYHIDGQSYQVDTLNMNNDFIPILGEYLKDHHMWYDHPGRIIDTVNKTDQAIPAFAGLGTERGWGISDAHVFYLEEISLGKNRLLKIDPITSSIVDIAPNYDVLSFIVNEDGGGVFAGLDFNDAKNYICSFDAQGNIKVHFEYEGQQVANIINLRKSYSPYL